MTAHGVDRRYVSTVSRICDPQQQAVLWLHRVRPGFVKARTAQANQIRSLLGEFGLIMPVGISHIAKRVPSLLEGASKPLPGSFRQLIARLTEHLKNVDTLVDEFEAQIKSWHRSSELSVKLVVRGQCSAHGGAQRVGTPVSAGGPRCRTRRSGPLKRANELIRILGGDVDSPEFAGWREPLARRRMNAKRGRSTSRQGAATTQR